MSPWSWKAMSWTFADEDLIRSRNLSSMHLPIPTPHHAVPDQKPTQSPRPRSRLQPALTWRLESVIVGFDFEKREIPREIIWTHPRTGSRWRNHVGRCQDELRQVNPLHPESKGGETKLLRRGKQGTRNLFDCVGRGEHTAWRILPQFTERRRGILEPPFCRRANAVFESNRNRMARSARFLRR